MCILAYTSNLQHVVLDLALLLQVVGVSPYEPKSSWVSPLLGSSVLHSAL